MMQIIQDLDALQTPPPRAIVTLGNFDGVHLGHREIFRRVVRHAVAQEGSAVVLTFVPHPLKLIAPEKAPPLINTYAEKERLISASCIDLLLALPFNKRQAAMTAEEFVRLVLVERLRVQHLVVGYDYAFGRHRQGDTAFLKNSGQRYGFTVEVVPPAHQQGGVCSSTRIRNLVAAGEVAEVVGLLGRHFNLEGEVVSGRGQGRQLGFPTANLRTDKELWPAAGVYAVKARLDGGKLYNGVVNIGRCPTLAGEELSLEVHLLDFSGEIYGHQLRVYFMQRLRPEQCFDGPQALTAAIEADCRQAREYLRQHQVREYREYLDCAALRR